MLYDLYLDLYSSVLCNSGLQAGEYSDWCWSASGDLCEQAEQMRGKLELVRT